PWLFQENYRNSKQIAALALAVTRLPFYRDVPDLVEPKEPTAAGPLPVIVEFPNREAEISFVIKKAIEFSRAGSVAILVRDRDDEKIFSSQFQAQAFTRLHRNMQTWTGERGLSIGTYHSAKGLEFDSV